MVNGKKQWAAQVGCPFPYFWKKKTFFGSKTKIFSSFLSLKRMSATTIPHELTLNNGTLLNGSQNKDTQGINTQLNGT
jgi:hypothetical protein